MVHKFVYHKFVNLKEKNISLQKNIRSSGNAYKI